MIEGNVLIADLPAAQYHEHEAMSYSGAKQMLRSPQHFKLMRTQQSTPTPQMILGTATHMAILEPEKFAFGVVIAPDDDKRTKAGKETHKAFAASSFGKIVLAPTDYARVERMADAVRQHPAAWALLKGAEVEQSLFWTDGRYRVPCKARLDARSHGGVVDVKTTDNASPEAFARSAASFAYHVQAAHYCSGCEHVLDASPEFFVIIAVESSEPFAVAVYTIPGDAILAGAHQMNVALERYAHALASGSWRGYPETIEALRFPKWALRFDL